MINDRIFKLIKVLEMNPTSFSDSIEVSVTVIFNIIKGRRSKPSYDLILKILKTYNRLNAEWLMKGEGSMWSDDIVTSEKIVPSNIKLENRVKELILNLQVAYPDSFEAVELDELVSYMIEESMAQKRKLVVLHERQEGMITMLKEKLKLKI